MKTKKSMFITTILMVAVLIVAVSTATFAWYTASGTATASNAVVTAAESADANIAISWTQGGQGTAIEFDTQNALQPMVPQDDYDMGTRFDAFLFDSASVDAITGTFNEVSHPAAWTAKEKDGDATAFYVTNFNVDNPVNVKMTAAFTGDLAEMANVAVFAGDELVAIFNSTGAKYSVGPVEQNKDAATTIGKSAVAATAGNVGYTFNLAENGGNVKITIKAWLDGELLTSPLAGKSATVNFTFAQA